MAISLPQNVHMAAKDEDNQKKIYAGIDLTKKGFQFNQINHYQGPEKIVEGVIDNRLALRQVSWPELGVVYWLSDKWLVWSLLECG